MTYTLSDVDGPLTLVPLLYDPSYEVLEDEEAETGAELNETLDSISETTFQDCKHATRSVHAKSHGLLIAEVQVLPNLPTVYAQGIFSNPKNYPAVIRLSTTPGDMLDDSVSTPRGFALKIIGVEGERVNSSLGDVTQDFVLVNGPAFLAPSGKKFLGSLKLLAKTTDKVPTLKKALSAVLRGTEKVVEALGGESPTIISMGGHPETHILGETFFSQAPILYGPYMAKISVAPVSTELLALVKSPLNVNGKPNGLRDAVVDFFATKEAEWEVKVQLCTALEAMPIEDSTIPWSEEISPYITVARIIAKPQAAWSDQLSTKIDDGMSFSPWHAVAAHRPIGSIMRLRKAAYETSAKFRALHNGVQVSEPTEINELSQN